MKTIELTRGIQITLITILIIVVATIAIAKFSNDETNASISGVEQINNENQTTTSIKGDINDDGEVDFKDLVKLNRLRLNKITEL